MEKGSTAVASNPSGIPPAIFIVRASLLALIWDSHLHMQENVEQFVSDEETADALLKKMQETYRCEIVLLSHRPCSSSSSASTNLWRWDASRRAPA